MRKLSNDVKQVKDEGTEAASEFDVAKTGGALDANASKVVVLRQTKKRIMTGLVNFRKDTGPTDSELRLQSRTLICRK